MNTNLQKDNQSNQSFDQGNCSPKSIKDLDLSSRPSLNTSLATSDLSLSLDEQRPRSLSEAVLIKGRASIDDKSFDTKSVKDNADSHCIFKTILINSKNFLLKSEVCSKKSEAKGLNGNSSSNSSSSKEASPVMQYYYPSLIPKPEPNRIINKQCIINKEGHLNYIQKEEVNVNVNSNVNGYIESDAYMSPMNRGLLGGYYTTTQPIIPFYPNENRRYSNQYQYQAQYDYEPEYINTMQSNINKYSNTIADPTRINHHAYPQYRTGPIHHNTSNPMSMPVSALMCENYSNEILGELSIYLIKEQNGCKLLQKRVKQDPDFANNHLFPNLLKDLSDLICDSFGNYLFQILLDYLTDANLSIFLINIKASFASICMSPYGTRVIQSLLEIIKAKPDLLTQLNQLLTPKLLTSLAEDPQGNYIIQKYIIEVSSPGNQFIYDAIKANFIAIAKTKQGCCTIQKCLKDATKTQKEELLAIVYQNMFTLITDQFGSYIFQYIIAKEAADVQIKAINLVLPKLVSICKRKYSSNAIEKCFENTNESIQNLLLRNLIENEQWIDELIVDSFGNYVIQKALMVSKGEAYMKMLKVIARNIKKLKQVSFGNKLISILITKHKELGHLLANEQQSIATEPMSMHHYCYSQRTNGLGQGHNLNQNKFTNKTLKPITAS